MRLFGLISLTLLMALPASAQDALSGYEELRDQGLLYLRKKKTKQAYTFLTRAYEAPGGAEDYKTLLSRGEVAQEMLLLEVAFEMADKAVKVADGDRRKARAIELQDSLKSKYGKLEVVPAEGETNTQGRIFFQARTGIINRKKRALFEQIRDRFRATELEIPATVYLPYGDYLANNVPVKLTSAEPAKVALYLQVERGAQTASTDSGGSWWIAGAGAAAAVSVGIGAFLLLQEPTVEYVDRLVPERTTP